MVGMESQRIKTAAQQQTAGKVSLRSVLRQTLIVAGALLLGYQLKNWDTQPSPLVPDANANVVTIQAFPSIEPNVTAIESSDAAESGETMTSELVDNASTQKRPETERLVEQNAVIAPPAVPLSELIPEETLASLASNDMEGLGPFANASLHS